MFRTLRNHIQNIHCRTKLFSESFLPSTIRLWNSLTDEVRNSRSLSLFKQSISNINHTKPPPYYLVGTRIAQIYHTRLRTNCSPLNLTLFQKNLIDSPLCDCGEIESTEHFLFICRKYNQPRQSLLNAVNPFVRASAHLFLFGSEALSYVENVNLFIAVQKFITETKRFY